MHNAGAGAKERAPQAQIGPNALIQTVNALREQHDEVQLVAILHQCNQEALLSQMPTTMVAEQTFADLVVALADQLGVSQAQQVLWRSGQLTAVYLLQHRIPRPFQWLLRPLPQRTALKLLLLAIRQHAWTFVGSGHFHYRVGVTSQLTVITTIRPAEAVCHFYGGTFDHLIHVLIDPQAQTQAALSLHDSQACCIYTIQHRERREYGNPNTFLPT